MTAAPCAEPACVRRRAVACLAHALVLFAALHAAPARAEVVIVGPEGGPAAFADALARARDGDVIHVLPGRYKGVTAVITHKRLTIRGEGARPVFVAEGKLAEGKGIFVVRDGQVRLENLEFRGADAPLGDVAGVHFERGRLEVVRCAFFDNAHALSTANAEDAELEIRDSEFARVPRVAGRLNHLLDVGRIARLSIQGSRLHRGFEGHLLKSRARESRIAYNMIRDGNDGEASYEVDLPIGGAVTLIGNVISQSWRSQNPVLISYGAEGKRWDRNELVLAHNTLISEGWRPAWFLRVHRDRVPGMAEVIAVNNLVIGGGIFRLGAAGRFDGNRPATLGMLLDATTQAFELPTDSMWRGSGIDPRDVGGRDLAPRAEFEWPLGVRPIAIDRAHWTPGAYQR
jgi:hypothetical protein